MVAQRVFCAAARGDGGAGRSPRGWDTAPLHLPGICSAPADQASGGDSPADRQLSDGG